jgi:hypothetical protein
MNVPVRGWLTGDSEEGFARSLEKRRQLQDAGRTTIAGCNGKVHGWRVVEEEVEGQAADALLSAV